MKRIAILTGLLLVSGCGVLSTTGENYAGANYLQIERPDGTKIVAAGGKDETAVKVDGVANADGSFTVHYESDYADATTPLARVIEGQNAKIQQLMNMLLQATSVPVGAP